MGEIAQFHGNLLSWFCIGSASRCKDTRAIVFGTGLRLVLLSLAATSDQFNCFVQGRRVQERHLKKPVAIPDDQATVNLGSWTSTPTSLRYSGTKATTR